MGEVFKHSPSPQENQRERGECKSYRKLSSSFYTTVNFFLSLSVSQISSHNYKLLIKYTHFKIKSEILTNNFCSFTIFEAEKCYIK